MKDSFLIFSLERFHFCGTWNALVNKAGVDAPFIHFSFNTLLNRPCENEIILCTRKSGTGCLA